MKKYFLFVSFGCIPLLVSAKSLKPNIVFILADDLGYGSIGCYGGDQVYTPNIDELAKRGVMLDDYHTASYSTPSRISFLTGRYAHRATWIDDSELSPVYREQRKKNLKQRWAWGISEKEVTIAKALKEYGYRTGLIGKWHLGYDEKFNPINYGFDVFQGHLGGGVDRYTHKAHYGTKELDWWCQDQLVQEKGYSYDLILQKSIDFIEDSGTSPFFLFLSHPSPHDPFVGRDTLSGKNKKEVYVEMIEELDKCVGEVKRTLERMGILDNTLLIFCSDNGAPRSTCRLFNVNGEYKGFKGDVFEGGTRVPFIASFPGVLPQGIICHETISIMDWFPTFVELCGGEKPIGLHLDGINVLEMIQGQDQEEKHERSLFWEVEGCWAVRCGKWKVVGYQNNNISLYDLSVDKNESIDLKENFPDIVKKMSDNYWRWQSECKNDMLNNIEIDP